MKILILLLFLTIPLFLKSQTRIDNLITVNFPSKPVISDTIVQKFKLKSFDLTNDTLSYSVIVTEISRNQTPIESAHKLEQFYKGVVEVQKEKMNSVGLFLKESLKIEVHGFIAYKTSFIYNETNLESANFTHILLNNRLYSFGYINCYEFNKNIANNFLNSIEINKKLKPVQYISKAEKIGRLLGGLISYILVGAIILWLIFRKKKN